ncbi:bifunctional ADP-dependent NAD(P)H-hydrate dehydratase/NAD(P)H-hydrate epimerase [Zafaria sp. Z1313]|uniref:bifunctional ADP-dependent NAD(P)H-hydrate dehydratase/NAD(P)H-hydrate epimerase n=1 Tax=unclassified Zafaria TaxID=2828765 RepID=UPI002E7A49A7|nr:NAD(P)H-hydrate dehydratase [Zafaria sp. J156]MEE1620507.1 NAD(P)H-hydrate dehydratase [Zafaria sp. J156]
MIPAWTGTRIREAEKPLLERGEGPALMRRAAHGLAVHTARLLVQRRGGVYGARVVGLIGPGNNGGDGLYALAELARRGAACGALLIRGTAHAEALEAYRGAGGRILTVQMIPAGTEVVVDAVLGTGARGGIDLPTVPAGAALVACDLPSGVDADTGGADGNVLAADLTVTFGGLKTGLAVGPGHLAAGRIEVVDIGLGPHLGNPELQVVELADVCAAVPRPQPGDHKYTRGVLGLVAGSSRYPGAAVLSATAAVNTGLGLLRIAAGGSQDAVLRAVPEAVPLVREGDRVQAWAVGPGIGDDACQIRRVRVALESGLPIVVDASALDVVEPGDGRWNAILTPHAGEASRLLRKAGFAVDRHGVESDPLKWARVVSRLYGSAVLLKGPTTVCASPDGTTHVFRGGSSRLATAGSGDVLTGVLGAVMATMGELRSPEDVVVSAGIAIGKCGAAAGALGERGFGASLLAEHIR